MVNTRIIIKKCIRIFKVIRLIESREKKMNISKRKLSYIIISIILILNIFIFIFVNQEFNGKYELYFNIKSNTENTIQIYYSQDEFIREENVSVYNYITSNEIQTAKALIPDYTQYINIIPLDTEHEISIENIHAKYLWKKIYIEDELIINKEDLSNVTINIGQFKLKDKFEEIYNITNLTYKTIYCIIIDLILLIFMKYSKKILILPVELINNRKLIFSLAKNDFKTKYAGSYLGIIWAFIQPIITVLIYWFVFQVGFKSAPMKDFPFVLWLIAGIIPWFFFQESLMNATNSLLEYSYLVKKVVFKVSVLPLVKIISALFVHIFFIFLAIFYY